MARVSGLYERFWRKDATKHINNLKKTDYENSIINWLSVILNWFDHYNCIYN